MTKSRDSFDQFCVQQEIRIRTELGLQQIRFAANGRGTDPAQDVRDHDFARLYGRSETLGPSTVVYQGTRRGF